MKGSVIALDQINGFAAAGLLVDGEFTDLVVDTAAPRPGTILRAKVDRVIKGQGGAFLTSPLGQLFLRSAKGLREGAYTLVQITGFAFENKAIPVTQSILFKSRYAIITPHKPGWNISRSIKDDARRDALSEIAVEGMDGADMGLILRSNAQTAMDADVLEDIITMRNLAQTVMADDAHVCEVLLEGDDAHAYAWREWSADAVIHDEKDAFSHCGFWDELEALKSDHVVLKTGHDFFIEETRAFVAVDINTGADTSKAAALKANRAALSELPRQLRLRGLGGQVVIDPAPFAKRDRQQLEHLLRNSFRNDVAETQFIGWTPLGHIELSRQRTRQSLRQIIPSRF